MDRVSTIQLMAKYNRWMNQRMYESAALLPDPELRMDRKAFFKSILGTLNHLAVADTIWLQRFAAHPAQYPALDAVRALSKPASLDQILFSDFEELSSYRKKVDEIILDWSSTINDGELDHVLEYRNMKGVASKKVFWGLVLHFFNHQTHHRGQASTLLTQAGADVGVTDLLRLIDDSEA